MKLPESRACPTKPWRSLGHEGYTLLILAHHTKIGILTIGATVQYPKSIINATM